MFTITESERTAFKLNVSPYSVQFVVEEFSVSQSVVVYTSYSSNLAICRILNFRSVEVIRRASYKVLLDFITEHILKNA